MAKISGLPGKSYLHIIELDIHINMILSYMLDSYLLDNFISSLITYKYRYIDRETILNDFINFTCTNSLDRLELLTNSKLVLRSDLIKFFKKLYKLALEDKIESNLKTVLLDVVPKIHDFQKLLIDHYLNFSLSILSSRRCGYINMNELRSDAYEAIIDAVDNYNYTRSKVPFNKFLTFHVKNKKGKTISHDLWGLPQGSLVEIDDNEEVDEFYTNFKEDNHIESNNFRLLILEDLISNMNIVYKKVLCLKHNLVLGLTEEEQSLLRSRLKEKQEI